MNIKFEAAAIAPYPSARAALMALKGHSPLFHIAHRSRHPFGIYSISFFKIVRRLVAVLDELDRTLKAKASLDPKEYQWDLRLLSEQDHLLDAIMEHFDDCKAILQCFAASKNDAKYQEALKLFDHLVSDYRDHIGRLVNRLKHNHRQLASIFYYDKNGFDPGYYAVAPDKDGSLGPDPVIHAGGRTAYSFARDLRLHVCGVYAIGEALSSSLAVLATFSPVTQEPGERAATIMDSLRRVSLLPLRFFPNELAQPVPFVAGGGTAGAPLIRIEYPAQAEVRPPLSNTFRVSYGDADEVSLVYRVPYAGPPVE